VKTAKDKKKKTEQDSATSGATFGYVSVPWTPEKEPAFSDVAGGGFTKLEAVTAQLVAAVLAKRGKVTTADVRKCAKLAALIIQETA
jgi:hypothetical protein